MGSTTLDDVILVVPALLPSWAAALWRARALVADSGGLFSHGAILARERGLPAVVGTRQATRLINEGQRSGSTPSAARLSDAGHDIALASRPRERPFTPAPVSDEAGEAAASRRRAPRCVGD